MDINWIDEIPGSVQGTPVNRLRLMGMQGYFPGTTTITETSDTETNVVQASAEGETTVNIVDNPDGSTTVIQRFVATDNKTITKTTNISDSGSVTTVTDIVQG